MSFTINIKKEISELKVTKSEAIAELSGYIRNNSNISKDKITMSTENLFIVAKVKEFITDIYDVEPAIDIIENLNFSKNTLYQITIKDKIDTILKDLGVYDENGNT